ncbi:MAG: YggT family protein [Nodosilinea sp.]
MSQNPNDYDNFEQRQKLLREQEAYRLSQEKQRLRAAQRRSRLAWVRSTILLLVAALEILLAIRFLLRVSVANPDNEFAQFIFKISDPFIAPFSTLFISPTNADATRIFDLNLLFAMLIYGLLGWLGVAFVNYLQGQAPANR